MHIFKDTHFDFLRWRWHAIILSWVIIIAGVVTFATKGIPRGVEFAGGTVVIAKFEQPVSVQQVRDALDRNLAGGGQNVRRAGLRRAGVEPGDGAHAAAGR